MDEIELLSQIKTGESQTVEFKESLGLINEIGEAVSAFSNTNNGVILIGIGDHKKIIGVEIGKKTLENLANSIKTHTDNHIFPKISIIEIENKNIIIIEISLSDEKPVFYKGTAYKRVGKSSHKLSASEIRNLAKNSGEKVYQDEQACKSATIDDIDEEKVRGFLRKANIERNLNIDEETPIKEVLEKLRLIQKENITNAAVLLFGKEPQKFFLQAKVRCAKFKGTEVAKPFLDMRVLGGTVFEQIDTGERFVLDNIKKAAWIEPGKIERQERWEYPPDAIREAITNAISHRDYESVSNVHISIFDGRIEIWSPGKLPIPLKPEDLKFPHKSVPVNPLLAEVLFLVKYIERWGSGTVDIVKWCRYDKLPEPLFKEELDGFSVVLRKYNISEENLKLLNERQRNAVEYVLEHGKITNKEYMRLNPNITVRTAFNDLNDMIKKRLMKSSGEKKYRYYTLA